MFDDTMRSEESLTNFQETTADFLHFPSNLQMFTRRLEAKKFPEEFLMPNQIRLLRTTTNFARCHSELEILRLMEYFVMNYVQEMVKN